MKYLLLILTIFSTPVIHAQSASIMVKAQKQTIPASLNDDNSDKTLYLTNSKKLLKTDKLVIYNGNIEPDLKRSFTIYNDKDAEVVKLSTPVKEQFYEISLKDVFTKLKKETDYTLYTMAVPKDPKRAALVRVRRVLICKIRVK